MGRQFKQEGFGVKGLHDQASSLADSLLSGKPLGKAKRAKSVPKLKPREKPKFGRKEMAAEARAAMDALKWTGARDWRFWIVIVIAVGIGLQALAGVLDAPMSANGPWIERMAVNDGSPAAANGLDA